MTYIEHAGAEATQEIASMLLKAAGSAMQRHGEDPNGGAIAVALISIHGTPRNAANPL